MCFGEATPHSFLSQPQNAQKHVIAVEHTTAAGRPIETARRRVLGVHRSVLENVLGNKKVL
jgi:hypothetical protein